MSVDVLNYVLSHARHTVVLRRNYAHFEKRTVTIKHLFKAIMKRDVGMVCKYGGEEVTDFFVSGNSLIEKVEGGGICFMWGTNVDG